ncbi:long-chain fatty acid--CoA ligase [Desulfofundulus salinus]|uniref:Long-chain fatty acid--CoA ligase n=1 Tax=Desulfofundulus salinus TaxID=2419843 RepID=A0A494X0R9_9FIRM|nr:long-chain fatty acid--CoA ligase [Desulfofundulus salinum]
MHNRHDQNLDHPALSYYDKIISYAELENNIEQYARFFFSRGVKQGERVALALPNCPEFIYSYLGIARAGGIVLPLNLLQTPQELLYILRDSGARFLVTSPAIGLQLKQLPGLPLTLFILDEETQKEIMTAPPVCFPEVKSDEVCTFLYTSGTTGQSKAVMLTHDNLLGNVRSLDEASDFGRDDNFLAVLPMFHSFGWTVCVLLPLYLGCTITILDNFRPKEMLQVLSEKGITVFCGVPSMFTVLLKLRQKASFPRLKFVISGGDSISEENMLAFEKKFNFPIVEGYGLSEASPVVCLNPLYGVRKIKSIGLPLPGVEVKVVDEEDRELPAGEIGELVVRGPNVMKGYYNREEETREVLRGGWLHTGDLAYRDQDGYFYIAGRKKELIITAGFNVYPREVEEALASHPSVAEAAVIGVPHPLKGEVVKAFVVPEEGRMPDKQELLQYLKGRLAIYKIPEEYVITSDLPRGMGGKVMKRFLK